MPSPARSTGTSSGGLASRVPSVGADRRLRPGTARPGRSAPPRTPAWWSARAARRGTAPESVRASRIAVSRDWASGWSTTSTSTAINLPCRTGGRCRRPCARVDSAGMTATATSTPWPSVARLRRRRCAPFLHGLPGVDQVGAEQRAAMLGTRSIKTTAKAWAIDLAIRMVDLTTLEGADTPGKVRALCAKARRPDPADPSCPRGRPRSASTRRWSPVAAEALARLGRPPGQRGDRVPVRPGAAGRQAGRHPGRGRGRRRRDRHGDQPGRVPGRPLPARSSTRSSRSRRPAATPTSR